MSRIEELIPVTSIEVFQTPNVAESEARRVGVNQRVDKHSVQHRSDSNSVQSESMELRRVSVIIPYSKLATIGRAIESVLAQEYPTDLLEIIVVGKGSTSIVGRFPRVLSIDEGPILQPGRARNLGAAHASGDFILFLDDDCEAQPRWIEENLAELQNELVGAVSGVIKGNSGGIFETLVDYSNFGSCRGMKREKGRLWSATFGMRRDLFWEIGGFDETIRIHEDIDLCFRLNASGYETVFQPKVSVDHNHGRDTFISFIHYQFSNGRRGGLTVESRYPRASWRNLILSKSHHPLIYSFLAVPFAIMGTIHTVWKNMLREPEIILFAPPIAIGKLACHFGVWVSLLDNWLKSSWTRKGTVRAFSTIVQYVFFKRWFSNPRVLTLYVTSACNAKCKHCFYWASLNQKADLSLEEIAQLSNSLGKVDKLLIAGGEPFLRRELPEIIQLFYENNDLGIVSIPTNGLTPDLISRQLEKILAYADGRPVRMNLSLDGTEAFHDEMRGVPGNFQKVVETYRRAREIQSDHTNLVIGVNSCAMDSNYENLFELYEQFPTLFEDVELPGLILLRGDPYEPTLGMPGEDDLERLHKYKRTKASDSQPLLWKLADRLNYKIGLSILRTQTQVIPCEAGRILGVVEDNGTVRHCELLPPIGNLREDTFEEIWNSTESQDARKKIVNKECHCTHECNVFESLMAHPVAGVKAAVRTNG